MVQNNRSLSLPILSQSVRQGPEELPAIRQLARRQEFIRDNRFLIFFSLISEKTFGRSRTILIFRLSFCRRSAPSNKSCNFRSAGKKYNIGLTAAILNNIGPFPGIQRSQRICHCFRMAGLLYFVLKGSGLLEFLYFQVQVSRPLLFHLNRPVSVQACCLSP